MRAETSSRASDSSSSGSDDEDEVRFLKGRKSDSRKKRKAIKMRKHMRAVSSRASAPVQAVPTMRMKCAFSKAGKVPVVRKEKQSK